MTVPTPETGSATPAPSAVPGTVNPAVVTTVTPATGQPPGGGQVPAERTLTQAEVNRIVQERVNQTKAAAAQEFASSHGVSLDEAKKIIKQQQDAQRAQQTEAERAAADANAAKTAAEQSKAATDRERWELRVDRALIVAGAALDPDSAKADAALIRLRGLITAPVDAAPEAIKADVEAVKAQFPALFASGTGQTEGQGGGKAPSSDPSRSPASPKVNTTGLARGADRAKAVANPTATGLSYADFLNNAGVK